MWWYLLNGVPKNMANARLIVDHHAMTPSQGSTRKEKKNNKQQTNNKNKTNKPNDKQKTTLTMEYNESCPAFKCMMNSAWLPCMTTLAYHIDFTTNPIHFTN